MIKATSIFLLSTTWIASGDIEAKANGCPTDDTVHKILLHENCNKFYKCINGEVIEITCPEGLAFNAILNVCDLPSEVECDNRKTATYAIDSDEQYDDAASICVSGDSDGILVEHEYCNHLYMCARGVPIDITCPEPLLYNTESKTCDWENRVDCGDRLIEKGNESQE